MSISEKHIKLIVLSEMNTKFNLAVLPLIQKTTIKGELHSSFKLVDQSPEKGQDVIILPQIETRKRHQGVSLIVPAGLEVVFSEFYKLPMPAIIGTKGNINSYGDETQPLHESDMNIVLRHIYNLKPELVYVCLLNSIWNNKHELAYRNLLKTPGFQSFISSNLSKYYEKM